MNSVYVLSHMTNDDSKTPIRNITAIIGTTTAITHMEVGDDDSVSITVGVNTSVK